MDKDDKNKLTLDLGQDNYESMAPEEEENVRNAIDNERKERKERKL